MTRLVSIITLIVMMAGCTNLQPLPNDAKNFSAVFEAPGASKDQIYTSTKIWVAENFRSAKAVLEYENKEDGTIIGNGIVSYPCTGFDCVAKNDWKVPFTMRVDIKDQKFKLTFSNIGLSWPASSGAPAYDGPITRQGHLDDIRPRLLGFGPEIVAAISKQSASKDW